MANKRIGKCSFSVFLILDNVRSLNKRLRLPSCLCKNMVGNISLKLWREITVWENKKRQEAKQLVVLSCLLFPVFHHYFMA